MGSGTFVEFRKGLKGTVKRKMKILKRAQCWLVTTGIERRAAEELVPRQFGSWEAFSE